MQKTKRGKKSYEKGAQLERRVARWLKRLRCECRLRDLVRGKIAKRPYEVDIHATRKELLGLITRHIWVECKACKVKRTNITKLAESARDVRDAYDDDIEKWKPDMLMMVSSVGFDVDALGMASKYNIYCVNAGKTFKFVGKMAKQDFLDHVESKY